MKLVWTRDGDNWRATHGEFVAEVRGPSGPLGFCHWSVCKGERRGGSGGTSSLARSKRAAENEVERFSKWLESQGVKA